VFALFIVPITIDLLKQGRQYGVCPFEWLVPPNEWTKCQKRCHGIVVHWYRLFFFYKFGKYKPTFTMVVTSVHSDVGLGDCLGNVSPLPLPLEVALFNPATGSVGLGSPIVVQGEPHLQTSFRAVLHPGNRIQ